MPVNYQDWTERQDDITSDMASPIGEAESFGIETYGGSDLAVSVRASSESETCTIQPWYWDGTGWTKGASAGITGSTLRTMATLGTSVYVQLISVSGTFAFSTREYQVED